MWDSETESGGGRDYGGNGVLSATKSGVRTDGFEKRGQSWYVATDIPSDLLVQIGDISFHLHKSLERVFYAFNLFITYCGLDPPILALSAVTYSDRPSNNNARQLTCIRGKESERKRTTSSNHLHLSDDSSSSLTSGEVVGGGESENGGLVDMLAVAISHVEISEAKRSRICSPSREIQQECSSNLKTSNLCTAF